MYLAGRWADRQLSKLELVIVVMVFSLILFIFMQYMFKMFAVAERNLMINSITNINTSLQYTAAAHLLRGDYAALELMQGINPFAISDMDNDLINPDSTGTVLQTLWTGVVLMRVPGNYLGELDDVDPSDIDGGNWYFDRGKRTLVYRVDNAEYFVSNLPGTPRAEFRVEVEYEDQNNNGRFDLDTDRYLGIRLQAVNQYIWGI